MRLGWITVALGSALLLLAGWSVTATAQPVMVLSSGNQSCGSYVKADEDQKQIYLSWALGFITGVNIADKGNGRLAGRGWDEAGTTVWLQNYCTLHPLENFITAATKLRVELGGNNVARQKK